jgi:hypothetical protein
MMQGPKRITSIVLSIVLLSATFLDYWGYSRQFYKEPGTWLDVIAGTANAPSQYRIGVVYTANFLAIHLHLALRHTLTLLDLITAFIAVFTLFLVLRRSATYRNAGLSGKWLGAASFVVMTEFYLAWLLWYQRPETLPTTAILSVALLLLTVRLPLPAGARIAVPVVGIILLAAMQGFVRADVGFALQIGVLLVCLTPMGKGFALPRAVQAGTSLVSLLLVLGIQYALMRKIYPDATYGDTPVLQLFTNLKSLNEQIPFVLFLLPFGWTFVTLARRRYQVEAGSAAAFTGALLFLGMWVTVGRIEEVRIFLPFAMTVIPLTVELAMQRLLPREVAA